jgi:hypothetical protein
MRVATSGLGELDVPTMKKYIQYAKAKCAPRLSDEAGDILASSYVKIRDDVRKRVMEVRFSVIRDPAVLILSCRSSNKTILDSFHSCICSKGWWTISNSHTHHSPPA